MSASRQQIEKSGSSTDRPEAPVALHLQKQLPVVQIRGGFTEKWVSHLSVSVSQGSRQTNKRFITLFFYEMSYQLSGGSLPKAARCIQQQIGGLQQRQELHTCINAHRGPCKPKHCNLSLSKLRPISLPLPPQNFYNTELQLRLSQFRGSGHQTSLKATYDLPLPSYRLASAYDLLIPALVIANH